MAISTAAGESTARIEAFSDGVFSIAITLLTMSIVVAPGTAPTNAGLVAALLHNWPDYYAYLNSFATVLLMWMMHHSIFKLYKRTTRALMLANGLLLFLVALLPYPTKTLSQFITTPARDAAVQFYLCYFLLISGAFNLLLALSLHRREKLHEHEGEAPLRHLYHSQRLGLLLNGAAAAVSFLNPLLGLGINFATWVYWATRVGY